MNQTLTQIQEEFDEKFTYQKPTRKYGKILYATPVLLASVDEIKSFLTQSNLRVIEKVRQVVKSELLKRMMKYDSKDGYSTLHDEILEKVSNDVDDILSTLIEQK